MGKCSYASCLQIKHTMPVCLKQDPRINCPIVVPLYTSINVKPHICPLAYVGHLTFQKNFWSKSPPCDPKIWSNQIKYSLLWEVISLNFIVVVVYILQIIDINCEAFLLIHLMLCVTQGKQSTLKSIICSSLSLSSSASGGSSLLHVW